MLDLIELWKKTVKEPIIPAGRTYSEGVKPGAVKFDQTTKQSSFAFRESPQVFFVRDTKTFGPVDFYNDLPKLALTPEEEAIRQEIATEKQASNPDFYDGSQMLLTEIVYDEISNIVFLVAVSVPYTVVLGINGRRFPEESDLYHQWILKTGSLVSLSTTTGESPVVERAADGLYSTYGGFFGSGRKKDGRLNFYGKHSVVTECAATELDEEIGGVRGSTAKRLFYSGIEITALSIRTSGTNPIGTAEFVTHSPLTCGSRHLSHVIRHNRAPDAYEHTGRHVLVPLDSRDRDMLLTMLLTGPTILPGAALYLPVILSTVVATNDLGYMSYPRVIPGSSSTVLPLDTLVPKPQRSLGSLPVDNLQDVGFFMPASLTKTSKELSQYEDESTRTFSRLLMGVEVGDSTFSVINFFAPPPASSKRLALEEKESPYSWR